MAGDIQVEMSNGTWVQTYPWLPCPHVSTRQGMIRGMGACPQPSEPGNGSGWTCCHWSLYLTTTTENYMDY